MAGRLAWAGYGTAAWALLAAPVHAYHAVTPGGGPVARAAHVGAAALLVGVAALGVALVHPAARRVPSGALVVPAFVVCVATLAYAARSAVEAARAVAAAVHPGLVGDVAGMATSLHPSRPERVAVEQVQWLAGQVVSSYPVLSRTGAALWALALGLLLVAAAAHRLGGPTARRIWLVVVTLGVLRLLA